MKEKKEGKRKKPLSAIKIIINKKKSNIPSRIREGKINFTITKQSTTKKKKKKKKKIVGGKKKKKKMMIVE